MKHILFIAIISLFAISSSARIHVAAEAGFGNTGIKAGYNTSPSAMYGVMVGKQFKMLLVDIGVRSWSCNYSAVKVLSYNGSISSGMYEGRIVNISVPISAGIYLPLGKINFLAKAVIAPTFLTQHNEKTATPSASLWAGMQNDDYSKRYYTSGGFDIGLGYSFTKRVSLDAKYSLLGYLSDIKHNPVVVTAANPSLRSDGERPRINAFSLQLNLFL